MKVLLVEDHPGTRQLIRSSLESRADAIECVDRVSLGLQRAARAVFDVIVIDIELPDGSGLDLCRELRKARNRTPILFLTARGEVADRISGLDAGADDYLRKPFALAELHARLRALARRAAPRPPEPLMGAGWSIDFEQRRLNAPGREIPLTAKEWRVLEHMAVHSGRLVARNDLLESTWGSSNASASESLDVIVCRLRRKLAALPNAPALRTVRGEGFVFDSPA